MYIEARVVDVDTGNTYFTERFQNTQQAMHFAEANEDENTVVKFKLVALLP